MPRKPDKPKPGSDFRVTFTLPGGLVVSIDKMAKEIEDQTPGSRVTRTDVIRRALYAYVK